MLRRTFGIVQLAPAIAEFTPHAFSRNSPSN